MVVMSSLRTFRVKRGLSQQQVAAQLGIGQAMVSALERGTRAPSPNLARHIAQWSGGNLTELQLLYPDTPSTNTDSTAGSTEGVTNPTNLQKAEYDATAGQS